MAVVVGPSNLTHQEAKVLTHFFLPVFCFVLVAATMAELAISPVLQVVFDRLASPMLRRLGSMWNLTTNFEKLKRTLVYVESVLDDAEEKQVSDSHVRTWLVELRRVSCAAKDLLDDISLVDPTGQGICTISHDFIVQTKYADRVREILHNLETAIDEGYKFNLRERIKCNSRQETSSFVVKSEVYGREEDADNIMDLLLNCEGEVLCVPIVGLGGLGKTTLAQLLFNDERVTDHFDLKTWVFVHEHYDAKDIMMALVRSVTKDYTSQYTSMEELSLTVWGLLHKKRYLIVLDDVWMEDQDEWERLRPLFRGGANGSKIILTTRSRKVELMINSPISPYHLNGLCEEACWFVFMQRAFRPGEEGKYPHLLPIGKEIIKKCGGVALAAKSLGSLMRLKREKSEWLAVLDCEIWELGGCESGILQALRLSYNHLPFQLRRCFSFCSLFPRRYEILKDKLIHQWMGAGMIESSPEERPEDVGNGYFNCLLWMSFFQEVNECDSHRYRMHDVVYDLAQSVSAIGREFTILDGNSAPRNCAVCRHSSVVCDFGSSMIPQELYEAKRLQTLLLFSEGHFQEVPPNLFSSFKHMRELALSGSGLEALPSSINELVLLRYLDVSYTHIKYLTPGIEQLQHLQTLDVTGCYDLVALPNFTKLSNLRHLKNTGCKSLTKMYSSISRVDPLLQPSFPNQLQTLPLFVVGDSSELMILEEIDLQGSLKITHLQNVIGILDSEYRGLKTMKGLKSLGLYWGEDEEEESDFERFLERKVNRSSRRQPNRFLWNAAKVLNSLMPNPDLNRLIVKGYPGNAFPAWSCSITSLTAIKLIDCRYCEDLPTLGNLNLLNSLQLQSMHSIQHIGEQIYGESIRRPFPALRELILIDFPILEEWSCPGPEGEDMFTSLSKLIINKCPKLTVMPQITSNIQHLELRDCTASLVHYFQKLTSLKVLVIQNARDLTSLPGEFPTNNSLLTSLEIKSCPIHVLPSFENLTALKALTIRWCEELSYLPQGMENLNALESLEISDCHRLIFLPELGTRGCCRLRSLFIENCSNLTSLSMGFNNITSLEHLIIMYCPSLVTLPQGLKYLSSLQSLDILGCCSEFKSLPDELQNLVGLHSFEIGSCPGLNALPEWIEKLVSLRSLAISDCHNITSLPVGIKYLTGLQHLSIQDCPQLLERCRPQGGEDWPNISHVPYKHLGSHKLRYPNEASSSSN